jgi:hypothetical protein
MLQVIVVSRVVKRGSGWYIEAFFDNDQARPVGEPIGPFETGREACAAHREFMEGGIPAAGEA